MQSVLDPAGPQSAAIERLWWLIFWISLGVFAVVVGVIVLAVIFGRLRAQNRLADGAPDSVLAVGVIGAVAVTTLTLFVVLGASTWTTRVTTSLGASSAVSIAVTGHQFWWEVEYEDATPSRRVKLANEIHIPVGRPVVLKVTSRDVIHSLWVPNLNGKRDLVPGVMTAIWIQADRPGIYRGQCAEFCGKQHAHMALDVVAEPDADFERWLDRERQPAREPQNDEEQRGREAFLNGPCSSCHMIRGTLAHGHVGPDLTHLATRSTIAAATLPNSRGHLAAWILDAQAIKPGSQMPPNHVGANQLHAILAYLESLR